MDAHLAATHREQFIYENDEQRYLQEQYQQYQKQQQRNTTVDQRAALIKQQQRQQQHQQMHELAQLTAMALQQRCSEQRQLEHLHQTSFHSARIPQISVWDYVRRIAKYSECSPECFIISIIFIDRYVAASGFPITIRNIHRLCITSVMLSAKLRDDRYFSNEYYASIGGISNLELNMLELEFLKIIGWLTWVEPSVFVNYCSQLRARYFTNVGSEFAVNPQDFSSNEFPSGVESRGEGSPHSVGVHREGLAPGG